MLLRALLAFLLLPGIVAIAVPVIWLDAAGHDHVASVWGFPLLLAGGAGLLWCVRDFFSSGKGTLAPWDPPRQLVSVGLYRYSRNPMYVCVTLILLGWAFTFGEPGLLIYAACVAVAFELRVVFGEEPWLTRTHGDAWRQYAARVPRWLW
jgi:protein-S-isoprenylcysteine O-methyltransferase Ste14